MRAIATRDAGLALASRIKRWLLAGAVTLSGFFSLLAAHAFHGHLQQPASAPASAEAPVPAPSSAPSSAPAPAPAAPAPVVSGGS